MPPDSLDDEALLAHDLECDAPAGEGHELRLAPLQRHLGRDRSRSGKCSVSSHKPPKKACECPLTHLRVEVEGGRGVVVGVHGGSVAGVRLILHQSGA